MQNGSICLMESHIMQKLLHALGTQIDNANDEYEYKPCDNRCIRNSISNIYSNLNLCRIHIFTEKVIMLLHSFPKDRGDPYFDIYYFLQISIYYKGFYILRMFNDTWKHHDEDPYLAELLFSEKHRTNANLMLIIAEYLYGCSKTYNVSNNKHIEHIRNNLVDETDEKFNYMLNFDYVGEAKKYFRYAGDITARNCLLRYFDDMEQGKILHELNPNNVNYPHILMNIYNRREEYDNMMKYALITIDLARGYRHGEDAQNKIAKYYEKINMPNPYRKYKYFNRFLVLILAMKRLSLRYPPYIYMLVIDEYI